MESPPSPETIAVPADALETPLVDQQWSRVRSRLRATVGEASFESWFKNLNFFDQHRSKIILEAPSAFILDWLESHYQSRILDFWRKENPDIRRVEIRLAKDPVRPARALNRPGPFGEPARGHQRKPVIAAPPTATQLAPSLHPSTADSNCRNDIGTPLDPRFTFSNFVTGTSNELACASARTIADSTALNHDHNPLFIYGGVGLGKTHLMHAIAWERRRRHPEHNTVYLSSENFMYHFMRALRRKDTMSFKQQIRDVDVLLFDDIQFITNKNHTIEEFFHTFEELISNNRQVIISANCAPAELSGIDERLRSRLWGLVVDIRPTAYNLRNEILQSKIRALRTRDRTIHIPPDVVDFLAHHIDSNIRELEGALNRLIAYASVVQRPLDVAMAETVLKDLLHATARRITIDDIQKQVASYFDVKVTEMLSARRARIVARPRQIAMYLAKHLTPRSLPEIGRKFGGRDHTTVIHAVRKIDELCSNDAGMKQDVDVLRRMIEK